MHISPAILNLFQSVAFPVGFGGGIGTGSGFNPNNIPGLAAWYDAGYGVYSDGAAHFTKTGKQSLTLANAAKLNPVAGIAPLLLTGWIRPETVSGSYGVAGKWDTITYGGGSYLIWSAGGTDLRLELSTTNQSQVGVSVPSILIAGNWAHFIAWWDGSTINLKVNNGTTVSATATGLLNGSQIPYALGTFNAGNFFDGSEDSMGVGFFVPTANDIAELWNSGNGNTFAGLSPALQAKFQAGGAWHDCNEESGTRFDATNNSNDLTASNTVLISPSVNNGGFESDTGGTIASPWVVSASGTSTITDTTTPANVHSGSHACQFDIDASNSISYIYQPVLRAGDSYSWNLWGKASASSTTADIFDGPRNQATLALTTSYTQFSGAFVSTGTNFTIIRDSAASRSLYFDAVTLTDLGPVGIAGIAAGVATDGNFCGKFVAASSQYLSVANNSGLEGGNTDWFVSFWFNAATDVNPVGKNNGSSIDYSFAYSSTSNNVVLTAGPYLAYTTTTVSGASNNSWNYVVGWYDSVQNKLFLSVNNGTPVGTTVATPLIPTLGSLFFGNFVGTYSTMLLDTVIFGKPVNGTLSGIASTIRTTLFNDGKGLKAKALTPAQIAAWGIISGWDMDKQLGLTADSVGTNTLTNNNGVTYGQGVDYYEGAVSKWYDKSGNGFTFLQDTQAKRPVYYTNVFNSKSSLLWDGVDDRLTVASPIALGTSHTAFIVVKFNSLTASYVISGASGNALFYIDPTNLIYTCNFNDAAVTHGIVTGTLYLLAVRRTGTTVRFYKNGAQLGTDQTLAANDTMTVLNMGTSNIGTAPGNFYLAGNTMYTQALTDAQMAIESQYFRNYYAIY